MVFLEKLLISFRKMTSQYATSYDQSTMVTHTYSETHQTRDSGIIEKAYIKGIPGLLKGLEMVSSAQIECGRNNHCNVVELEYFTVAKCKIFIGYLFALDAQKCLWAKFVNFINSQHTYYLKHATFTILLLCDVTHLQVQVQIHSASNSAISSHSVMHCEHTASVLTIKRMDVVCSICSQSHSRCSFCSGFYCSIGSLLSAFS